MAIFGSTGKDETTRRQPGLSIIAAGMVVHGDIETDGIMKVEGKVYGSIRAARQILVAPGALVEGDLDAREAVIGGEVRGTIRAEERVEVQASAVVAGDLVTARIAVLEGGQVNGEIKMGLGTPVQAPLFPTNG